MFQLSEIDKADPDLHALVQELDTFQCALYPAESNHCIDLGATEDSQLRCILVRDPQGRAAGCGAVYFHDQGRAEMKRVYIRPEYRGQKLGEQIVAALEQIARAHHCHQMYLETGVRQQPAQVIYKRCGYAVCEAFPPYTPDPLSVFMQKKLLTVPLQSG